MPVATGIEQEELDSAAEAVIIEVGDLVAFSGAHLHRSGVNRTGRTRFSTEVRTVERGDFAASVGATNVDGEAPCVTRQWFTGVRGGAAL